MIDEQENSIAQILSNPEFELLLEREPVKKLISQALPDYYEELGKVKAESCKAIDSCVNQIEEAILRESLPGSKLHDYRIELSLAAKGYLTDIEKRLVELQKNGSEFEHENYDRAIKQLKELREEYLSDDQILIQNHRQFTDKLVETIGALRKLDEEQFWRHAPERFLFLRQSYAGNYDRFLEQYDLLLSTFRFKKIDSYKAALLEQGIAELEAKQELTDSEAKLLDDRREQFVTLADFYLRSFKELLGITELLKISYQRAGIDALFYATEAVYLPLAGRPLDYLHKYSYLCVALSLLVRESAEDVHSWARNFKALLDDPMTSFELLLKHYVQQTLGEQHAN